MRLSDRILSIVVPKHETVATSMPEQETPKPLDPSPPTAIRNPPSVTTPVCSLILCSYNRPKLIVDAIQSIQEQDFEDWELIIVDDASDEFAKGAIIKTAGDDPRIRIIWEAGGTPSPYERATQTRYSVTINRGLQEVRGKYIFYRCDDDALGSRKALSTFVEVFEAHPHLHVLYGRSRSIPYSHDQSNPWNTNASPRPGRIFMDNPYTTIDPDTGRPVDYANWKIGFSDHDMSRWLDHGQVVHRVECLREMPQPWWPVGDPKIDVGDAVFFAKLDKLPNHRPLAVDVVLNLKKYHNKSYGIVGGDPTRE